LNEIGHGGKHEKSDRCSEWRAAPQPEPTPVWSPNELLNPEIVIDLSKTICQARANNAIVNMDTMCATCGKPYGQHFEKWCDKYESGKQFVPEQPSLPAGAREHKENEVMKTIRDANGTTIWWGKPLAGRGEAAEQEQNKAGISASSGTTFITSSAPNERPASSPAGFSEAYAKKETERADAAERDALQLIDERDSAEDALQKAHIALGGDGEWTAKLPPEESPESGDLRLDVPALAESLSEDLKRITLLNSANLKARQTAEREVESLRTELRELREHCVSEHDCSFCGLERSSAEPKGEGKQ
jgi:hypothetical protein